MQIGRLQTVEVERTLIRRVPQIIDFGICWFTVHVFQQQMHTFVLSINTGPLKTFKARLFPLLIVRGEMESGMNDDPFGIKPSRHVNVGP